jgi:hypothetical protein
MTTKGDPGRHHAANNRVPECVDGGGTQQRRHHHDPKRQPRHASGKPEGRADLADGVGVDLVAEHDR